MKRKLKILYKDKKSLIPYLAKFEEAVKGETLTKVTYDSAVQLNVKAVAFVIFYCVLEGNTLRMRNNLKCLSL